MGLHIVPITFAESRAFIARHHRHHPAPLSHKFSVAVADGSGVIRGVATVGRPVARHLDNGWTLEVNRACTDGARNANSMLYGAAWRVAKALGYRRLITYTLETEGGASLRGAGWRCLGARGGGSWDCKSRPRVDKSPTQTKLLWEA